MHKHNRQIFVSKVSKIFKSYPGPNNPSNDDDQNNCVIWISLSRVLLLSDYQYILWEPNNFYNHSICIPVVIFHSDKRDYYCDLCKGDNFYESFPHLIIYYSSFLFIRFFQKDLQNKWIYISLF